MGPTPGVEAAEAAASRRLRSVYDGREAFWLREQVVYTERTGSTHAHKEVRPSIDSFFYFFSTYYGLERHAASIAYHSHTNT